jgi:hypothetical protein
MCACAWGLVVCGHLLGVLKVVDIPARGPRCAERSAVDLIRKKQH